jgi:hypothetical protein
MNLEKKIIITMNQIDGSIDFKHEGEVSYAESLGMIEYTKMMIHHEWMKDIDD